MADIQLGQLVWKVTGDNSGLKRSLADAEKSASGLGSTFKKMGGLIAGALATAGIVSFFKNVVKAASDAEETSQKFGVVFSSIAGQANKAAQDLARNYGLSSNASKQLLSDTGDLLTGFGFSQQAALDMSNQVNQLAVDLASFTNFSGGAKGASDALTKGLLGEREAMKSLGIAILDSDLKAYIESQGKSYEAATRQEKAQATLEMAYRQSKNAIGDFARSSTSFANQQRVLNAIWEDTQVNLGQKVLPVLGLFQRDMIEAARATGGIVKGMGEFIAYTLLAFRIASQQIQLWTATAEAQISKMLFKAAQKMAEFAHSVGLDTLSREVSKAAAGLYVAWGQANEEATIHKKKLDESIVAWKNVDKEAAAAKDGPKQINNELDKMAGKLDKVAKKWSEMTFAEKADVVNQAFQNMGGAMVDALGAASQLTTAIYNQRLTQLDAQMQAELEAAGVAEETTVEQAQREYDAAVATGNQLDIEEKRRALEKAKIFEKYEKKKRQIEYESNLAAWQYQLAQAIIQSLMAPLNAYTATLPIPVVGPVLAPIAAALAATTAGLSVAAVAAAKPQPPKFATGGIVPGNSFSGDNVLARVNSGEVILNQEQQKRLLTGSVGQEMFRVSASRSTLWQEIFEAAENGNLFIPSRAVLA